MYTRRHNENLLCLFMDAIEEHRLVKRIAIKLLRQERVEQFMQLYRSGLSGKSGPRERRDLNLGSSSSPARTPANG